MILDINDSNVSSPLNADLCIIGSGAAGIAMAREFIGTSHKVIVLEAGGQVFEDRCQEPYRSEVVGLKHEGIHTGRARVLGGTTTLWAGQVLPLFDIDFIKRDWVPLSGWPIKRKELFEYYLRAERVMQVPASTYDVTTWPNEKSRPPEYDPQAVVSYCSQFTHVPDFAKKYGQQLSSASNITVLTRANAIELKATENADAITQVIVKSFEGKQCSVRARMFVVCCGGIESARLLLASNSVEPNGVGNRHDVVGRYFQDHPGVVVPIRALNRRKLQNLYNSFRKGNVRHSVKLAASESLQRKHKILNVGGEIFYPAEEDDPLAAAKVLADALRKPHLMPQVPSALKAVGKHPHKVLKGIYRRYVLGQVASVNTGPPHMGFGVEQMPNPQSRITLSDQVDSLGMRRSVLDWRVGTEEARAIAVFADALLKEWQRLGIADFDLADLRLEGRNRGENGGYIDASHHMGTTRMGTDPTTSVVNSSCKVHDYDNLYIASSSVFPTGGFSNPTLTMLALSIRVCDELKNRLDKTPEVSNTFSTGMAASAAAGGG
jgi:choline dehydrogenase-like flavoprotein